MVRFQVFRHCTFKGKRLARTQHLSPGTISSLRYATYQDSCSPEAIFSSSQADFTPPHSPHCVEVIIRRHVVFIITGQTQLIPITLVDKVPELLWTERLKEGTENSIHFHLRILKYNEFLELPLSGVLHSLSWKKWEILTQPLVGGQSLPAGLPLLNSSDATRWIVCVTSRLAQLHTG